MVAAMGRRVLALDVRGRGDSARDPNADNYNPLVYADDVVAS
jgi:pimeloyl-ACP methyl ester carboxylesterase